MSASLGWLLVAAAGVVMAGGAVVVLRTRLTGRVPEGARPKRSGWEVARGPLAAVGVGIFVTGVGVGGALSRIPLPYWDPGLEGLVSLTPEPMEEPDTDWEVETGQPLPRSEPAWPEEVPPQQEEAPADTAAAPVQDAPGLPPDSAAPVGRLVPLFAVRAGVFRDRENADALQEELRGAGYPPILVPREDTGGLVVWWVYAGTFATRESADVAVRELARRGVEAVVVNASEVEGEGR